MTVTVVVGCSVGIPAIVAFIVLGRVLMASIRAGSMNNATAMRHLERRYRQADDHMIRIAEIETGKPDDTARIHAQERMTQASRDASVDMAAIDAMANTDEADDHEVEGGCGYVDQ